MVEFMAKLRERITIGVVGGSDLPKQKEQLGESGEEMVGLIFVVKKLTLAESLMM